MRFATAKSRRSCDGRAHRNVERQIEWYGEPLGDRFGRLLARLGLPQAQLAGALGLSAPMLSQLMSGRYARRSPISYAAALARTAVRLVWSAADTIIPGQPSYHAHALAEHLRALGGHVDERIVTHAPISPDADPGRYAHEACDTWEHLAWANRAVPMT